MSLNASGPDLRVIWPPACSGNGQGATTQWLLTPRLSARRALGEAPALPPLRELPHDEAPAAVVPLSWELD